MNESDSEYGGRTKAVYTLQVIFSDPVTRNHKKLITFNGFQ